MTSIAEDPSLPLDLDGTSNQLSNSSHYAGGRLPLDATLQDLTSSISSELEQPGTFPNLTSAGRVSPHRTRTMKDQEMQLAEFKKENFGLKLRIYHLEEALRKQWGDDGDGWQMNIELQVQLDNLKKELTEKDALLLQAKSAIDTVAAQHDAHIREMQRRTSQGVQTEQLQALEERLDAKEEELAEAQREAEQANERMEDLQAENNKLEEELQEKDEDLGRMERENEGLRQALAEKEAAVRAAPAKARSRNTGSQTAELEDDQLGAKEAELEATQAELREKDDEVAELRTTVGDKDKRIHELEVALLSSSQKLATGANEHAQQLRDQGEQLDECKGKLQEAEDRLRQQGAELEERDRQLEGMRRKAREAETHVNRLQPLVQQREREIEDLRDQLQGAEGQAASVGEAKDGEIQDLRRRLRDSEAAAADARPRLTAQTRQVEELSEELRERDEEISRLRTRLREKEEALSQARTSAHNTNMENQEKASAIQELRDELEALREQLRRQHTGAQHDLEAALAAKNAIVDQLRRDLQDMQARMDEADQKIVELTASKAAELGVLRETIEDLSRQLEHHENLVRALRAEVGQLVGEKASLQREVDKLRSENQDLLRQLEALQSALSAKERSLAQAERTIAELQRIIEDLQSAQPQRSELETMAAEMAQMRAQLATLDHSLRSKKAEAEALMQTVQLKDNAIKDLQEQVRRLMEEKARLEERIRELEEENNNLEGEVANLQSQMRISKLSSDDLQRKLTEAYGEREDLAQRLKATEDRLRDKGTAHERAQAACQALQDQVKQLQQQVTQLIEEARKEKASVGVSATPDHDASTSTEDQQHGGQPGASSTTMIFGTMSESLLLTILQRLQELYAETTAGRADSKHASSTMSSKLEHIAELQKHLEGHLHSRPPPSDGQPPSSNTTYSTYYFMHGEDEDDEGASPPRGTPKKSSTPRSKGGSPWGTPQKGASPRLTPQKRGDGSMGSGRGEPSHDSLQEQVRLLQSELEEVRRWNESLQSRLDESGGTRNVGVGMEKGGDPSQASMGSQSTDGAAPERYRELEKEVDRLLAELEAERERSQEEREQQEEEFASLQAQLRAAEEGTEDLREQLRQAMRVDAATSTDDVTMEALQEETRRLKGELDEARRSVARLRGKVQAEGDDNRQLRDELANLRLANLKKEVETEEKATLAASSMPNLVLTPERSLADSWTTPGQTPGRGSEERLDVRELREKHDEMTRLNQKLQRKCHEQLKRSPPHTAPTSRPGSGGTSTAHWQSRLREQEQAMRSEMLERERSLLTQLRESEARYMEREGELKGRDAGLRKQVTDLECQLRDCRRDGDRLRSQLAEALATIRTKDEEIENLRRSLAQAQEKVMSLEAELDRYLTEKTGTIGDLESENQTLQQQLQLSRERVERLERTVGRLGREQGEGAGTVEREVQSLQESVDSLTQQLTTALEELEESRRQNVGLEEQIHILNSQLGACHEQVQTLHSELSLYHKLLQDTVKGKPGEKAATASGTQAEGGARPGPSLSAEKVLELLEEIRSLRDQLDQSIRSNNTLAERLRERLNETSSSTSETHFHYSHTSPPQPSTRSKSSQTSGLRTEAEMPHRPPPVFSTSEKGSATSRVHLTERSTSTTGIPRAHPPTAEKASAAPRTSGQSRTSSSYRSSSHYQKSRTSAPHSPIPTLSFTELDSSSGSHTHRQANTTKASSSYHRTATTYSSAFTPSAASTPYVPVASTAMGGASPRLTGTTTGFETHHRSEFTDGVRSHHSTRGTQHSERSPPQPQRSRSDEFRTPRAPGLDSSSSSSFFSHSSTTRLHDSAATAPGESGRAWGRPAGAGPSLSSHRPVPHPPPHLSSILYGSGNFDSLETRLQQALDSSALQGADRAFLEELLMYLRQQRRQLDDSRRLLERLEQQQAGSGGVGQAAHIGVETAESGTMPSRVHGTQSPLRATGAGGARSSGAKVDLSSLYEQLTRTHASLVEAKSTLKHQKPH